MKKILLSCLMIAGLSLMAQTPRLSLYEEFTGETCPPCAATNPGFDALMSSATNTPLMTFIKWQVPIPSAPTNTWSLYQTNKVEIDWRADAAPAGYGYNPAVTYAPFGKIDGQSQAVFGATGTNIDHPGHMNGTIIATAQSYTSAFSVTMARAWDATFSSVNLTISITASASFTAAGSLVFRTAMIEETIHFPSQPGTNGEVDFHNAVIACFPSLQTGVPMASNWILGQTQTFTLNCPLPSYTRDKSQVAFVGFIQDDGNQKVAQSVRAAASPLANDAKAISASIPFTCTNVATPTVVVKNNGSNVITGFSIIPTINGVAAPAYNWTGSLAVGASTTISLPSVSVITGLNIFSYNINSVVGTDNNLLNNTAGTTFVGVTGYQGTPVAEGFVAPTFPPTNWATYNTYGGQSWIRNTATGGFQLTTNCTKLDFYSAVPSGAVNELLLPPVSFTNNPIMAFDVAYSQYATTNVDQLDVFASTDCGQHWTNVFTKSGAALSTVNGALTTPPFTPTAAAQWRRETITFPTGFTGDILVKFVGTSDFGNNLYLDNINLQQCLVENITATSTRPALCKGEKTTLTAQGATSFLWDDGSTTTTISVHPTTTTSYTITSTNPVGCGSKGVYTQTVNACTGISAANMNIGSVSLYPNPTSGVTTLNIELVQNETVAVSVMNAIGQEVYSTKSTSMNAGTNTLELNTENWAAGVYFVKASAPKSFVNQKLTVTK